MARWQTAEHLADHFARHGRKMGYQSVVEFDAGAQATLNDGRYFEFQDPTSDEPRLGCFDRGSGRFVILNDDDAIVTFYITIERYIRRLPYNNYDVGWDVGKGSNMTPKEKLATAPTMPIADRLEE